MKKRSVQKKIQDNTCSWFDTENARLIILCAILGIFGAHKFAMGKKGQGWCFIILDLTIIGILISAIWAFFDLLFLTVKRDNKPGNMILGSIFLVFSLLVPVCLDSSYPIDGEGIITGKVSESKAPFWKSHLTCETENPLAYAKTLDVFVRLYDSRAILDLDKHHIVMPLEKTERLVRTYIGDNDGERVSLKVITEDGDVYTAKYGQTIVLDFASKESEDVSYKYNCRVK